MSAGVHETEAQREAARCQQCGVETVGLTDPFCPECVPAPAPPATAAAPGPMGSRAATGFLLMSGQSLATRALSFGAQILLAHLLTRADFGLFGLATAVVTYANLAQQIGVREVLLSRQNRIDLWSNVGFWVSAATGLLSSVAILISAPIAGWFYQDARLGWMLVVLALAQPLYSLSLVQEAKVQSNLRFRYMAVVQFVWGALSSVLQVVFALLRFGAFAFVLPRLVAGVARCWMLWRAERIVIRRDMQWPKWKYVLGPGVMLLLTGLANSAGLAVPTLVLGRVVGKGAVGDFSFAYNLSIQAIMLMSMQFDSVLFPTLGKMAGEPQRQRGALLRAARALMAAMVPICLFQIVAARPLLLLVFGAQWETAIVPLQILSIGMLVGGGFAPALSLLQAQGRFGTKLLISVLWGAVSAIVSIGGIFLLPHERAVEVSSLGMAMGYIGFGFHNYVAATRPLGGHATDALRVVVMPVLIGVLATVPAWWLGTLIPASPLRPRLNYAVQIGVIGASGALAYPALLRLIAPSLWKDLMDSSAPVVRRLRRLLPGAAAPSA